MNVTFSDTTNKDTNDEEFVENDSHSDDSKAEILDDGLEDVHLDSNMLTSANEGPKPCMALSESLPGKDSGAEARQEACTTVEEDDFSSPSPLAPLVGFFQFPARFL